MVDAHTALQYGRLEERYLGGDRRASRAWWRTPRLRDLLHSEKWEALLSTSWPPPPTSSSPTTRPTQALHLHRRARAAARVDPPFATEGAGAPRRGVGGDDVPRLGVPAHGRARLPRPRQARGVRRPGRRLLLPPRPRRGDRPTPTPAASRWASRSTPTWRCRRSSRSAPRSRSRTRSCRRSRARRSSASASPSPTPAPTSPASRPAPCATATSTSSTAPRPTSPTATAPTCIVLVTKTDPDAGYDGFTLFLVAMDSPGVIREKKLEKLGMHASDTALLAFQDVRVPAEAVLGEVGKGFYHIMWELQGERLIGAAGCVAGRAALLRPHARVRQGAQGLRPLDRPLPGHPPQVRRDGDEDRGGAADGLHDRLALPERRVPGARDLDGQALRLAHRGRGGRRVHPDPRRRRLHEGVRRRARVARHAAEPHRRRHRRDHARRDRAVLRA